MGLFNWLFGIKPEPKEAQEKRATEINSTLKELQDIKREIEIKEREIEAINKYLKS